MRKKAESFQQYNEAAVLQTVLAALPEIARALAEPLSKTDRITMVSTGGDGVGVSKLTGDMAKVMAELPAVVESLSGVDLRKLIEAVPALRAAKEKEKTTDTDRRRRERRSRSRACRRSTRRRASRRRCARARCLRRT